MTVFGFGRLDLGKFMERTPEHFTIGFAETSDFDAVSRLGVDYDLKRLSDTIEPLLIVAIGGIVLVLALGVYLPMWDMAAAARGG